MAGTFGEQTCYLKYTLPLSCAAPAERQYYDQLFDSVDKDQVSLASRRTVSHG